MEVSALNITNVIDSTPRVKPSTERDTKDFNSVLNKVSSTRNSSSRKHNEESNKKLDDSRPVSREVKDALKKAGMSDEEVDSIKSVKDLKNVLAEKIVEGDSSKKVDSDGLLAILVSLLNNNAGDFDFSKLQNILDQKVKDVVYESISRFSELNPTEKNVGEFMIALNNNLKDLFKDNSQLLKLMNSNDNISSNILKDIIPDIKNALNAMAALKDNKLGIEDILSKIQTELSSALKESLSDLSNEGYDKKSSFDSILDSLKLNLKNSAETVKTIENTSENNEGNSLLKDSQNSEEENFLKSLVSEKDNSKISKATNFMSQFNTVKNNNPVSTQLENIVVNKNNFSADMIKALKYMDANNMKDLTVKIAPKELGEVIIRITMESGVMKANISAANKDAYNLLNSNLQDITSKLQNNEVKIQSLTLNIYNEDTTFFKDESQRHGQNNESKNKKSGKADVLKEDNVIQDNESIIDNNVNMLA